MLISLILKWNNLYFEIFWKHFILLKHRPIFCIFLELNAFFFSTVADHFVDVLALPGILFWSVHAEKERNKKK